MTNNMVAEYWKNDSVFQLTDGSNNARSNSICVNGRNVYVAGSEYLNGNYFVAKYWMDGAAMDVADDSNYSMANSIVNWNDDIYLAGKDIKGPFLQGSPKALYWENGRENSVEEPSGSSGWTNSIVITENNQRKKEKIKRETDQYESDEGSGVIRVLVGIFSSLGKNSGSSSNYRTHKNRSFSSSKSSSSYHFSHSSKSSTRISKR
jgi:hypothetical protein